MNDFTGGTVRACCARVLAAAAKPLTAAVIADKVDTTAYQARRALRQLEAEGAVVRRPAAGGRYVWRAR